MSVQRQHEQVEQIRERLDEMRAEQRAGQDRVERMIEAGIEQVGPVVYSIYRETLALSR